MGKLVPRWYQADACSAIMGALTTAANVNPVAAIVTGGGKALLAAMLAEALNLQWPGARVMVLAPSMELVKQNVDEAVGYLPPALVSRLGVYCAGLKMKDRLSQFIFGTPQSVTRQAKRFGRIDFVIVDEAHVFDIGAKTAKKIVDGLTANNPGVRFIALTATDFRMKGLKVVPLTQCGLFSAKVYDLTSGRNYNRLVREGYLAPVVAPTIRFPQVDTEGVKTKGGDFDEAELARRAMEVTKEAVAVALENAPERKHFMWFAVNIEHARMIHNALVEASESSVLIHGDLEHSERVEGIESYLLKQQRHIVSVAMLTTGFNAKFVDCLVSLRPTKSLVLWRQIVGRGFRPYPGKENVLLLDGGGNIARHGPINASVDEGDSRAGLWRCSDEVVHMPVKAGKQKALREKSSIRFPVNSDSQAEPDLRVLLDLMEPSTEGCQYLNDAEHMTCRQCGRPRQGFLALRQRREKRERSIFGEGDSYELHDEDSVVLRDEVCELKRQLEVRDMRVTPEGNSVLNFEFATDFGPYGLRLDFDRTQADPKFYAQARKYFTAATGRNVPTEAYRVVLQRELIPAPVDITLTKLENGQVFLTECRFLSEGNLRSFRYDPRF
ncbi:MAG: DEAD/DEAH box helicase family protein [Dyella sp.]|nr:DEAD/DEAH box helicase family protein [Dyella sp.]